MKHFPRLLWTASWPCKRPDCLWEDERGDRVQERCRKRSRHNPKSSSIFFVVQIGAITPRITEGHFPLSCLWRLCQWLQMPSCDHLSCYNKVNLWELERNCLASSWPSPTCSLVLPWCLKQFITLALPGEGASQPGWEGSGLFAAHFGSLLLSI